ncbi:MAG: alpha/beta fold hydrolase [Myxococcota bacterium]
MGKIALAGALAGTAILMGCRVVHINTAVRELEREGTLVVEVSDIARQLEPSRRGAPVVVRVFRGNQRRAWIAHRVMNADDPFYLKLSAGTYAIDAFEDGDRDVELDVGERLSPLRVVELDVQESAHIRLRLRHDRASGNAQPRADRRTFLVAHDLLSSPRFGPEEANASRFRPRRSMRRYPAGLFAIGRPTPAMPVIFVHGYAGYAQQFERLLHAVPEGAQAWVFQYPMSVRVEESASRLRDAIEEMSLRFGYQRVAVVAHSAGGIVARRTLALLGHASPVRCMSTLSTPMAGVAKAAFGIRRSPVVIPLWRDLAPGSTRLERLFSDPVRHHDYLLVSAQIPDAEVPGDGTIAIDSQRRQEAVEAASDTLHVEADHEGVLSHPEVVSRLGSFLSACQR